jgi:hypothetical protein
MVISGLSIVDGALYLRTLGCREKPKGSLDASCASHDRREAE